jgi:hypothetical protein
MMVFGGFQRAAVALLVLVLVLSPSWPLPRSASSDAGAPVFVEEDIEGNVTWGTGSGPYRVARSISIDGRLVVEPGVVVEVASGATVTVRGELVLRGNSTAPVVVRGLGGPWTLRVLGGGVEASNTVFEGVVQVQAVNATVSLRGFNATGIVLGPPPPGGYSWGSPVEGSEVVLVDGWLDFLSYWGLPGEASVEDSSILIRNVSATCICPWSVGARRPSYVLGRTGAYYPPPLEDRGFLHNSSLRVAQSCFLLGVDLGAVNLSDITLYESATREVFVARLESSNLTVLGGEVAWGRGIYVVEMTRSNAGNPLPRLVVHNTSIHDLVEALADNEFVERPVGVRVELVGPLGVGSEEVIDLRYNWWGDPSGPYNGQVNPEGRGAGVQARARVYPWLEAPPKRAEELSVTVEPPLPLQGVPFSVRVRGGRGPYLYVFGYGVDPLNWLARVVAGSSTVGHTYSYTGLLTVMEVPLLVVGCGSGGRGLAGAFVVLRVLPAPRVLERETSIVVYSPSEDIVSPGRGGVVFNASIIVFSEDVMEEVRGWVRALIDLNGSLVEMREDNGFYTYSAILGDGAYHWSIIVEYAGIEVARTQTRTLVVDSSPPQLLAAHLNTTTGVLTLRVGDSVSGVRELRVLVETGDGPRLVAWEKLPRGVLEKEYSTTIPPRVLSAAQGAVVVLEDWAGNRANYTISLAGAQTTATQPAAPTPAQATAATPTATTREWRAETAPAEGTQPSPLRGGRAGCLECLYNPLTLSLLAVVISVLAIIVAVSKKQYGAGLSHG